MSLNSRPNGKQSDAMREALTSASLKHTEKELVLKLWMAFKWRVKTSVATPQDLEAIVDEFIIKIQTEITHPQLQAVVLGKFDAIRKRAAEVAARPEEFFGADPSEGE